MATITYHPTLNDWAGEVELNLSVSYDAKTNSTTVNFLKSKHSYYGKPDFETSARTDIVVTANDKQSSSATAVFQTSGYTLGGTDTFEGTPTPASVTVKHSDGAGSKKITISASTTVYVYLESGSNQITGHGSTSFTAATLYTLTKSTGTGYVITVDNTTAGKTGLASGALVAAGDKLKIRISARTGYALETHTVNDKPVNPDTDISHTVSGNVTVAAEAALKSYELTVVTDGKALAAVKRGAETLKSGDTVSHFDVLSVTVSAKSGYKVSTAEINGTAISPDTAVSHTVSGPVGILAAAEPLSNLFVDDGGTRRRVLLYIDDNGTRALYRAVFK